MGMLECPRAIPDTIGLPEFFVTDIFIELIGGNVRVICGAAHGDGIQWLYSAIVPSDALAKIGSQCCSAARDAFNPARMMEGQSAH